MARPTDIRPVAVDLYFLPIKARMPLKFGPEVTTEVTCARVRMTVEDAQGRRAEGWGETPLSVQWVWPSTLGYEERHQALRSLCVRIAAAWCEAGGHAGHPIEVGHHFLEHILPGLADRFNRKNARGPSRSRCWRRSSAASPFDLALHDAFGVLHGVAGLRHLQRSAT